MIGYLTPVWNYDGFGNGGLCPIKDFYHKMLYIDTPLPPGHMIVIWLFTPMSSCQVPHGHVITACNVLCQSPQKVNWEASREGCKLLLSANRPPFHLWGLDERSPCHSWHSSMHGAPNPSLPIPAESPKEAGREGHPALGLPEPWHPKFKNAWSPKSLYPCLCRQLFRSRERLPALCLTSQNPIIQRQNSSTITWAQLLLCSMT